MFASFSKKTINILFHCLSLYNCRSFVVYLAFHFWYIKIHGRWPSATSALKGNNKFEILRVIRHIQAYSEPFVALTYSKPWYIQNTGIFRTRGIFRTLVYSEQWYIQNPGLFRTDIFRTLAYSEPEAYSYLCYI